MNARTTATGLLLVLLVVACGQKPGVHLSGVPADVQAQAPAASTDRTLERAPTDPIALDGATGTAPPDAGTSAPGSGGRGQDGRTGAAGTSGESRPAGATGSEGSTQTSGPDSADGDGTTQAGPTGSDRTGAGPDRIVLGWHAPVTGAAPLPSRSFEDGRNLYWNHLADVRGERVLGRERVVVEFRDDKYNPSSAIQACRELANSQAAFLLVGLGGTDQVQACAQWANQNRVPYFSMGVTEQGLRQLPWYFALSMSYKQQTELLAQYVTQRFPGKKVAMLVTDTPNFDDALEGWEAAVAKHGVPYYGTYRHPKGDESWYDQAALEMARAGVEVIFPLTAPFDFIKFTGRANAQGYRPQYAGVGVSMGLNVVASSACSASAGAVDGAMFFSPFPGLDWARDNEPAYFEQAAREDYAPDDIAFALWGLNKTLHALLLRYEQTYGQDLTREDFRSVVEQQADVRAGIFPPVSYTPQDHFGSSAVHVLRADCNSGQYVTESTFVSGF